MKMKAINPIIAVIGSLVAVLGALTAVLAVNGAQPIMLGITLALGMIMLVVLGILIGLLRNRS